MHNKIQKKKSLIMCTTPFQLVIAEKIIKINSLEEFDLLLVCNSKDSRYINYYNRVKHKCRNSLYYYNPPSRNRLLGKVLNLTNLHTVFRGQLINSHLNKPYENYYLASIDNSYFRYIISKNKNSKVFTFDDGLANVLSKSMYHLRLKGISISDIIWKFLGVSYTLEDIKKLSLMHYTIYENLPNITHHKYFVDFLDKPNTTELATPPIKTLKIYIGQPLHEISSKYSSDYINKVLHSLNIDYYFPHPREKSIPEGHYRIIYSDLIFEDYILKYLQDNQDTVVHVYSFFSSCIINIAYLDRIKTHYMYDSYLKDSLQELYTLAEQTNKISSIDLDTL